MTVLPSGADVPHVQPTLGKLESSLSETWQQLTQLKERVLTLQASNEQLLEQVCNEESDARSHREHLDVN